MKPFKEALAEALEGQIEGRFMECLPSGFQTIGDIAIISLKPEVVAHKEIIGRTMLLLYPSIKTVCIKFDAVKGEDRLPSIEKLAGDGTETTHTENGCLYRLDVAKVMFSKGNVAERGRLAGAVGKDEVVVDMFAGIGYFSIPITKAGVQKVYALEINPNTEFYLEENIKLNKLANVEPVICDNRKPPQRLEGVADRVLMGYLPGTDRFLDAAFFFLKPEGGVIHFHNTYRDGELWGRPLSELEEAGKRHGMSLRVLEKHIVKQYGPRVQHVVVDAEFRKEKTND
jgi:tRNA wybutosine-synthesizing protein 2